MHIVAAFCICGSILCLLVRQYERPQAMLLGLAVCCLLLLSAMPQIQEIIAAAEVFFAKSGLSEAYFSILCKAIGISYLTQLGMDFCRDCGEAAIASTVELCGRVCLILLSLPLFTQLADIVMEVIG